MPTEKYYTYIYLDPRKSGDFSYQRGFEEVYCFNHEPFYIGKGSNNRINHHINKALNTNENKLFYNVIRKIYKAGLEPIRIKILQNVSEEEGFTEEINLINMIGRRDKKTGSLCNESDGGEGVRGQIRKRMDLTGRTFGDNDRIEVLKFNDIDKWNDSRWLCKCGCGREWIVTLARLRGGIKSCGCLNVEIVRKNSTRHGKCGSPIRTTWKNIYQCCYNKKNKRYGKIGGKGIRMIERWLTFENFLEDMGEKPTINHIFGRIDTTQDYTPSNCKWMTRAEEGKNRRGD